MRTTRLTTTAIALTTTTAATIDGISSNTNGNNVTVTKKEVGSKTPTASGDRNTAVRSAYHKPGPGTCHGPGLSLPRAWARYRVFHNNILFIINFPWAGTWYQKMFFNIYDFQIFLLSADRRREVHKNVLLSKTFFFQNPDLVLKKHDLTGNHGFSFANQEKYFSFKKIVSFITESPPEGT